MGTETRIVGPKFPFQLLSAVGMTEVLVTPPLNKKKKKKKKDKRVVAPLSLQSERKELAPLRLPNIPDSHLPPWRASDRLLFNL